MAVDYFLKLDGVTGESADSTHGGEIDVLSWSWGGNQTGFFGTATGGGAGKVSLNDMTFTKRMDSSTPTLFKFMCSGKHMATAKLTARRAGENPLEYMTIDYTNVMVSSWNTGGSGGDNEVPIETISMNFQKCVLTYTAQDASGAAGKSTPAGWDIAANKAA